MKLNLFYWMEFLRGYVRGYLSGKQSSKIFLELLRKYGKFEEIPTREFKKMGMSEDMMVKRQRLKIAALVLEYLAAKYANVEILNTMNAVADYLEYKKGQDTNRLCAVSNAMAVVQSLAFFAADKDGLDVDQLIKSMSERGKGHVWYNFGTNAPLLVTEKHDDVG